MSHPCRVELPITKQVDVSDARLAACLIQHSTPPCSSHFVVMPKEFDGVRAHCGQLLYKKLWSASHPPVDEVRDNLGTRYRTNYSLLYIVSSMKARRQKHDYVMTFYTLASLGSSGRKKETQRRSGASRRLTTFLGSLKHVTTCLDNVIVFDLGPTTHMINQHNRAFPVLTKKLCQNLPSTANNRRHGCEFPRRHHFSSWCPPERRQGEHPGEHSDTS